jgi:hypothetical protein
MVKDNTYWMLHKRIWQVEFDELDYRTQREIMENPNCREAESLQSKINLLVEEQLREHHGE